jgi:FkbM family methyltransferase
MEIATLDDAIDLLKSKKSEILFIQVGGCDGELEDPLRKHIVAGKMKGVILEPVKYYFDKLQQLYANSTDIMTLNCAIDRANGIRTMYSFDTLAIDHGLLHPNCGGISSFVMDELLADTGILGRPCETKERLQILRQLVISMPVECIDFETLMEKSHITNIDLLQVDAEGYDLEILKMFDFEIYSPQVVNFEVSNLSWPQLVEAESYILDHGYKIYPQNDDWLLIKGI